MTRKSRFGFSEAQRLCLFSKTSKPTLHPSLRLPIQWAKAGRGIKDTTHSHLVPRLRMSGVTPLLSHVPSCCARGHLYLGLYVRFEVLTVVTVQINAFWDVVLCSLVCQYQHVIGVSSTLKMEAPHSSKMLLSIYHATMCYIQEHSIFITEFNSAKFI